MKRGLFAAIVIGAALAILAAAVPLSAHHSFAATYFEEKTQTIEGDLIQRLAGVDTPLGVRVTIPVSQII